MNVLTKRKRVAILPQNLIRVTARFFSGVLHPHLLGVCCPNLFSARPSSRLTHSGVFTTLPPRLCGGVAQLVRALPCHGRGYGSEPRRSPHFSGSELQVAGGGGGQ